MAKKKEETKEVKKEVETSFNISEAVEALPDTDYLKAGFLYHIKTKNIPIKSENELIKQFDKFKGLNAEA